MHKLDRMDERKKTLLNYNRIDVVVSARMSALLLIFFSFSFYSMER